MLCVQSLAIRNVAFMYERAIITRSHTHTHTHPYTHTPSQTATQNRYTWPVNAMMTSDRDTWSRHTINNRASDSCRFCRQHIPWPFNQYEKSILCNVRRPCCCLSFPTPLPFSPAPWLFCLRMFETGHQKVFKPGVEESKCAMEIKHVRGKQHTQLS